MSYHGLILSGTPKTSGRSTTLIFGGRFEAFLTGSNERLSYTFDWPDFPMGG